MKDNIGVVPFPKMDKNSEGLRARADDSNFVPNKARNPLAGVAWIYYNHRRAIDGEADRQRLRAGTAPPQRIGRT